MAVDAILVLQRSDVPRIAARRAEFAGARLLFVDPGLLDDAVQRGLREFAHCEFRRLELGRDAQARAATEAIARATQLDLTLSAERARLWPGATVTGWDVGLFFLALQRAALARAVGAAVADSFPEPRIGLLRPTRAQQMYFDSFVSADLVGEDAARFAVVDSYDDTRWFRNDAYEHVFDAAALRERLASARITLVSHVPTCFYERAWLAAEVARAHAYTLDLASPFWDVPLHRGATALVPISSVQVPTRIEAYATRVAQICEAQFSDLLPNPVARRQQVQAWAARARWQALNHDALSAALASLPAGHEPQFLLCDQDAGLNGPLFTIAATLEAAITVVPHSGHASMLLPHAQRVTAVERAGYGCQPRSLLGQNVAVRALRFGASGATSTSPAPRRESPRVRRIALLLNSMATEGLSHVDAHALAAFYKTLAAWCETQDVELLLRPKPGAPALAVLSGALGIPAERLASHIQMPLQELAAACELCLAWGEPTTGVAPFLDAGSLVLQVIDQRWPTDYLVCLPLVRDGVIPMLQPNPALEHVQALVREPARFAAERARQSAAFDERAAAAHDHLFDLPSR